MTTAVSRSAPEAARAARTPRPMAWIVVGASGAAVLTAGIATTVAIISAVRPRAADIPSQFWQWVIGSAALTAGSLGLRALRWVFLLRRASVRIPIRDALIGYFSGFALMLVPLLIGEIAARAFVHRARAAVPLATTTAVTLWERLLDFYVLTILTAIGIAALGGFDWRVGVMTALTIFFLFESVRLVALAPIVAAANLASRVAPSGEQRIRVADVEQLAEHHAWLFGAGASLFAWMLPAIGFGGLVRCWAISFSAGEAIREYAGATLRGAVALAPGGVLVTGQRLLAVVRIAGLDTTQAAATVFAVRIATVGVAIALGSIFLLLHLRSHAAGAQSHFDDIAHAYDAQIPEARRQALLVRKTDMMAAVLASAGSGRRGLDVGCGQGWYVQRMRALGYTVEGIDPSAGQLSAARRLIEGDGIVYHGSALQIPATDASFDFVYTINVLHHLGSEEEQRAAFVELLRVLRPGGLIFVHEINTRNPVFRFYMGYVFPSLNCIDEGNERWLLPHNLAAYTDARQVGIEYFTFLPDFMPAPIVRLLRPIERALEASPLRVYSAHYMAILQKHA